MTQFGKLQPGGGGGNTLKRCGQTRRVSMRGSPFPASFSVLLANPFADRRVL